MSWGGSPCEDGYESALEVAGGGEAQVGAGLAGAGGGLLGLDPGPEVGVDQALQQSVVEPVVVDERGEAVLPAVPDVPDERAVVEEAGSAA